MKKVIDLNWEKDDSIYFPSTKEFQCKISNDNTIVSPNTLNIKEGDIKPGNIIMSSSFKDRKFSNLELYIFCIQSVNIDTNNITITFTCPIPKDYIDFLKSLLAKNDSQNYVNVIISFTLLDFIL